MSLPSILGMDALFSQQLLVELAEMEIRFDTRTRTGVDVEDAPTYSAWLTATRDLPDGSSSNLTPGYFQAVAADPGLVRGAAGDFETNRYQIIVPYAPDIVPDLWRVRQVGMRNGPTIFPLEVLDPPLTLTITEVDHVHPVLTTIYCKEVR